jgi:hypothetical protein
MLESGRDSENLRILASLSPPFDYWEVERYLSLALDELRIPNIAESAALSAYVAEELRCMLEGRTPQCDTLATLKQLFVNDEYPRALHPFYLLYFALQEISAGEETYHWPGATAENIHRIIEDAARNFLAARP